METYAERAVRRGVAAAEEAARREVLALMDAGLALMVGQGGRGARVADIVAAAGLSNDAFYRYFPSKDALVAAIVERGARTVAGYVRVRMEAVPEPVQRVRAGVAAVLRQASDPQLAAETRAVLGNAVGLPAASAHVTADLVDELGGLFGTALGGDLEAGRMVAASCVGAMQYAVLRAKTPTAAEVERLCDLLLGGVQNLILD